MTAGYVHIDQAEGYAVCSSKDGVSFQANGFDVNVSADGWGVGAISQPGGAGTFPLVVTRNTLDGRFQLKQTFTPNRAERGLDIRMAVKNLSGVTLDIRVMRSADVDISDNVMNWNPFGGGPQFARGCDAGINAGGFGDSVLGYRKNLWGLKPGQTQTFTPRYRRF